MVDGEGRRKNFGEKFIKQCPLVGRVGSIRQQWEGSDVDGFYTLVEETLTYTFIVASTGEQDIAADNFFGGMGLSVRAIIYRIAVTVHLIYGVGRWSVGTMGFVQFIAILFIKTAVIEQTILCIKQICQFEAVGFDDGKNNIGAVLGSRRMDFSCAAAVSMLIMEPGF